MRKLFFIFLLFPLLSFNKTKSHLIFSADKNFAQYVNPFIGTGGHGHTFPGATTPFGMVQLSPDTRIDGSWDGCSGYHYSDTMIYGFSHTHLSGTGCSDWGDIMLMPMMDEPSFDKKIYSSSFSHQNEKASPGFYAVKLNDDNIDVELTTTTRVGFHKYTFNKSGKANIIIDLNHRDELLQGEIRIVNDTTIEILRQSKAWATNQILYARVTFNKKLKPSLLNATGGKMHWNNYKTTSGNVFTGNKVAIALACDVKQGECIMAKVALSSVDIDGAKKNMDVELPHWNFMQVKADAEMMWNKELSKIDVGVNDKRIKVFYTALYHCMIHPSIANDVDGRYRGMDNKVYTTAGFSYYSVFSLWDTFRTLHPLLTIIDEKRTLDFIKTFLEMYKQTGRLPVWELSANETDCMIGYHAVSVITDAYLKGIKGFDEKLALRAMIDMSNLKNYRGLDAYKQKLFLEVEDEPESVSKTLEYAYNDWCIARFAKAIGDETAYLEYIQRSQAWKNLLSPQTSFMQPRSNGGWLPDFDPRRVDNNFTEGNSWQYSFFVPHDVDGMIDAMHGKENFEKILDELFTTDSKTTGREQADITGLVGQYAHGNEPSHHMAYLYNYIGKPNKTQQRIHQILSDFYTPNPDGLIGNEDCGQMSAWYVMSALGLYSLCPGADDYTITQPFFDSYKVYADNMFLFDQSIVTNQLKSNNLFLPFKFIHKKAHEKMEMDDYTYIVPSPIIQCNKIVFDDSVFVEVLPLSLSYDVKCYILTNEGKKREIKNPTNGFYVKQNCTVEAISVLAGGKIWKESKPVYCELHKRPNNWSIKIKSSYNKQYTAGGDEGLIDGLRGDENWRKGRWQGYQGQNFECVIDLKESKSISKLTAGFLQDQRSWIFMPVKVEFYVSVDGVNYNLAATVLNKTSDNEENTVINNFTSTLSKSTVAQYVKVIAYNYGKLPAWHPGAGGDAFIFVDEVWVE